jgi:hypothetical protein
MTPSGWFGNSKDMIVELENFMTEEEVVFLENAAKSLTFRCWLKRMFETSGHDPSVRRHHYA